MSERPALSLSVSRRPSLRASLSGASTPALASSPLSSHPPITPQNAHFWDSYFPAPGAGVVGLQTPPLGAAQPSLYPSAGTGPGRKSLLRRNSSLSSVSSSVVEDDEDEQEWTHDEEEQVQRVYDACLAKHALTEAPFPANGPPPSNFTNMVARAVLRAAGGSGRAAARRARFTLGAADTHDVEQQASDELDSKKWPHSLKSTRLKILALCKERQAGPRVEDTPKQADPDATPKRRQPLVRQDSMDFLPDVHNTNSIARLSNMLRQPSQDGIVVPPPPSAATSRFPPAAQLGTLGIPLVRSASSRPSYRMQRTNSLQSIAGSPSQPAKPRRKPAAADTLDAERILAASAPPAAPVAASSARMARTGSESSVLHGRPLARHLSFSPCGPPSSAAPHQPPTVLGASPIKKAHAPSIGLLTPPASSKKRSQAFTFASPPKNPLGLTLDVPSSATALKRNGGAAGLASAFTSPVVGAFPPSASASSSPKKKKAKVTTAMPARAPSFDAASVTSSEPTGLGLGFSMGGGPSALSAEASSSMFGDRARDDSPFLLGNRRTAPTSPVKEQRMRTPSFEGPMGTFTLLDPSASPDSLASRRNSPPKLTLTPSLASPTFSTASSSISSFTSSLATSSASSSAGSAVASPLSPFFDLNSLKLESLSSSPAGSVNGDDGAEPMDDDSDEDFGCDGGSNAFLNPEYVRAGHEAHALRERLGAFAWAKQD
ncbi:hypothetical protein JCM8208_005442 [Rhodotorula glutinis]